VPLSVVAINEKHNLGIFEAGISTRGEMQKFRKNHQAYHRRHTNIGTAHDEGFANTIEKLKRNYYYFQNAEVLIYYKKIKLLKHTLPSDIKKFS
jgi:alanine racemase